MRRILLVEDDPDLYPLLEHVLRGDGYGVDVAVTVAQARALLAEGAYDLVIADGSLPDGDGIEIADQAKERGIRTVVVTGYALRTPAPRLAQHQYLMKPIGLPELLGTIFLQIGRPMLGGGGIV